MTDSEPTVKVPSWPDPYPWRNPASYVKPLPVSEYLEFVQVWNEGKPRKTKIFEVRSKLKGSHLGDIEWYGRWRQYAFVPAQETVFNSGCLDDISQFIKKLMETRREHR